MTMNKKQLRGILAVAVVLIVYHILAFLIPFEHEAVFWVGYIFGLIAILVQIVVLLLAFHGTESARSKFYGLPIARVGILYFAAQMIVSFAAMALAFIWGFPTWPVILVSAVLLCLAVLGVIATDATRDEIERQDVQLKKDVNKMRTLQSLGRTLATQTEDQALKAELQKLSDELRFSDPVSSAATADSEAELTSLLDELQRALLDNDAAGASGLCKRARAVLGERNRICKLNKG